MPELPEVETVKRVLKENNMQSSVFDLAEEIQNCIGPENLCSRLISRLAGQIGWEGAYKTLQDIYEMECGGFNDEQ